MKSCYDLIIIGSGPAGLSAGIYAQRARLNTLLIEKSFVSGGQVMNTYEVDNYPGLPGISGMDLSEAMKKHADKLELPSIRANVTQVCREKDYLIVETRKEEYRCKSLILATGARHRLLEVPGEAELAGMGVSYCATCDGAFFKGKTTAVVGGGDVALEDALFLARICEKVYLIHRRDEFRGSAILREQVAAAKNIQILWDTVVKEIHGDDQVQKITVTNVKTEEDIQLDVGGVFIAVGIIPNTEIFRNLVQLDSGGYIAAPESCITSAPGIFAAGDVRRKKLRQIITAAADGANAVTSVQEYLLTLS